MTKLTRYIFPLLLLFVLPACDSGGDDEPELSGIWTGTTVVDGLSIQMDLNLRERDGAISGNGSLNIGGVFSVNINGTHNYPDVTLNISDGTVNLVYSGTVAGDDNTISGNLTGGGLTGVIPITLRR